MAPMDYPSSWRAEPAAVTDRIAETLRRRLGDTLRWRGVVATGGGVARSVCAGPRSRELLLAWVEKLGVPRVLPDPDRLDTTEPRGGARC